MDHALPRLGLHPRGKTIDLVGMEGTVKRGITIPEQPADGFEGRRLTPEGCKTRRLKENY